MEQNNQLQPPVFNQPQPSGPQYQPRVSASPMMDPVEAVKTCFRKYFDFKGRARRSEYWWFVLFVMIVSSVFNYGGLLVPFLSYVGMLCSLLLLIPQFAAMTRRLHDTGRSGWWVAILAILYVVVLVSMAILVAPYGSQLFETTDSMVQAEMMADAYQSNPVVATVMSGSAFLGLLLMVITFIFTLLDSKWGENKYGPSPKYQ